uniref:dolichyl-P-Man:Man5GlcNAc2-PP-dolichol alpha-1,3-mannosyltransferase n=3 Tax=Chloropicon primus TaxID=1764295 RepID=A0A7S2SX25_9CHLO|mmetsp:Transcript_11273/g.31410  ORF Transcript_11273/g.31410 Transcript_11273/m.31410 type:complete len:275 (+) Transcript_11273:611-1435(+)
MFFGFLAIHLCQRSKLLWAALAMSVGISIKMNLLLMLPGFLLLLVKGTTLPKQIFGVVLMIGVQFLVAMPFAAAGYSSSYLAKAFEFSRVFIHHWTVNFKFLPEEVFVSTGFAKLLLGLHLAILFAFAHLRWCRKDGGVFQVIKKWSIASAVSVLPLVGVTLSVSKAKKLDQRGNLDPNYVADVMFGCNFVGILCARSLHYQFYSWYFPTMVYLLFSARGIPAFGKVLLLLLIEVSFNVFPSTPGSSALLTACHVTLTVGYFLSTFKAGKAKRV